MRPVKVSAELHVVASRLFVIALPRHMPRLWRRSTSGNPYGQHGRLRTPQDIVRSTSTTWGGTGATSASSGYRREIWKKTFLYSVAAVCCSKPQLTQRGCCVLLYASTTQRSRSGYSLLLYASMVLRCALPLYPRSALYWCVRVICPNGQNHHVLVQSAYLCVGERGRFHMHWVESMIFPNAGAMRGCLRQHAWALAASWRKQPRNRTLSLVRTTKMLCIRGRQFVLD